MSILDMRVAELIKRKVYLEILRKTLEWDRGQLQTTKMQRIYDQLLDQIISRISDDLRRIKQQLHKSNARIVQDEQYEDERYVAYNHQGYVFERSYPNRRIKIECEQLFQKYLQLRSK